MTKEDFNKVWSESSKENILNQFYYDYTYLIELKKSLNEIREIILYSKSMSCQKENHILQITNKVLGEENDSN